MGKHEHYMERALHIARTEMRDSKAAPFAAVVVKDGVIVGEGVNRVVTNHDPTSHGEVEAIRDAGRNLGTWDLKGCTLYTTCEPCEMCVAAMFWANIDAIFYAATLADVENVGFDLRPLTKLVRSDLANRDMTAERVLGADGTAVINEWAARPDFAAF